MNFNFQGCDASVLLNSPIKQAEKDAPPNKILRGYEVIEKVKSTIEIHCPEVVSCADIIALVSRDVVVEVIMNSFIFIIGIVPNFMAYIWTNKNWVNLQTGGASWQVETGRRDGVTSSISEALDNLPPPFANISSLKSAFHQRGLDNKDLVVLSGI